MTVREQETGALRTLHRVGQAGAALREIVQVIDGMAGEWLVLAISSPSTIMHDLHGRELRPANRTNVVPTPETYLLGRIGRRDLLAPERRAFKTRERWRR